MENNITIFTAQNFTYLANNFWNWQVTTHNISQYYNKKESQDILITKNMTKRHDSHGKANIGLVFITLVIYYCLNNSWLHILWTINVTCTSAGLLIWPFVYKYLVPKLMKGHSRTPWMSIAEHHESTYQNLWLKLSLSLRFASQAHSTLGRCSTSELWRSKL